MKWMWMKYEAPTCEYNDIEELFMEMRLVDEESLESD